METAQNSPDILPNAWHSELLRTLHFGTRSVHLLGVAHVSPQSVKDVQQAILQLKPHTVCVELDEARLNALKNPSAWGNTNLFHVLRKGWALPILARLALASYQRRIGQQMGVMPGEEMLQAVEYAKAQNSHVVLADRDVRITLRRAWSALGFWEKCRLLGELIGQLVVASPIEAKDIETLKQKDVMQEALGKFAKAFPRAKAALLDERDAYMAHFIYHAKGPCVLAVLGAAHCQGVQTCLQALQHQAPTAKNLHPLQHVPKTSVLGLVLRWALPLLGLALLGGGFVQGGGALASNMLMVWGLANGIPAAIGAIIATAHPVTVLTAFVAAPFTSLNPLIGAGWVAGIVELLLRKPKVCDAETLPDDIGSIRGFWRNNITRILLVTALTNLGSAVGTAVGLPWLIKIATG